MSLKTAKKDLVFPNFDDIKVSTKTFIVMTNLLLDLERLFDFLPVTNCKVVPKKRGRKKKTETIQVSESLPVGSILTMRYKNKLKGSELNQKKQKKNSRWFRNSFTVVMLLETKKINFKVYSNGMFQVTGCKLDCHAEEAIKFIWNYIKDDKSLYKFKNESGPLEILFVPAMRNVDFSLGFYVDREKLTKYISTQTEFYSLLETSFGYTGVNIKLPLDKPITEMNIKKLTWDNDTFLETTTTYNEYLNYLSEKDKIKKLNKERYSTFLTFHSGRTIISSVTADYARDSYHKFCQIIRNGYEEIVERLDI